MSQWKVDIREPDNLVAYFKDKGATVTTLEVADYVFADLVGFERKSLDFLDFEHMFVQVDELIDKFPFAFLVVDQKLEDLVAYANKNYHRNMLPVILGAVASLAVRGCPPIFFGNQMLMLTAMEKMAAKSVDGKDRSAKRMLHFRNLDKRDEVGLNVLRAFGVGSGRAEDIAEAYGGDVAKIIDTIVNKPEDFKKVSGVGDKTIEKIREAFVKKSPRKVEIETKIVCPKCGKSVTVLDYEVEFKKANCNSCGVEISL